MSASPTDPTDLLEIGRGIFALILFSLSLYAWSRRRQPALIMVAAAFLLFFMKTLLDYVLPSTTEDVVRVGIDFVALALFFVAIVVRPRRDLGKGTS
ncbi:hypothetical protein E6H33_00780 [Candidatus Bathyarchaeota archaeon]|nr:MAG: hypothetical protein E6H33_00780 [Candidatus Bathyarchaeota archaeon]